MSYWLIIAPLLLTNIRLARLTPKADLTIEVSNITSLKGSVFIAVFKLGSNFPNGKPSEGNRLEVNQPNVSSTFSVEPGTYAVAVFHDENNNNKLDTGLFGIPKEPYGFSKNFRPTFSAPKFSDCQIQVDKDQTIRIRLK